MIHPRPYLIPLLLAVLAGIVCHQVYRPLKAEREFMLHRLTLSDHKASEKHVLRAVALDPGNTVYVFAAGQYLSHTDRGKALDLIEQSILAYNGDIVRWAQFFWKGMLKYQTGAIHEAREAFLKSLWFNPLFEPSLKKLAEMDEILEKHDKVLVPLR